MKKYNDYIARLMSEENISVVRTNHYTAYFNTQDRILAIPYFENETPNIMDVIIPHEVGHALYTDNEDWQFAVETYGNNIGIVNVIEDIRIEKLMFRKYPGLISRFMGGYSELRDRDFFKIKDEDISDLNYINRLNIKSKLRSLIEVPFNDEEERLNEICYDVETWQDVIEATNEVIEFLKSENKKKEKLKSEWEVNIPEDFEFDFSIKGENGDEEGIVSQGSGSSKPGLDEDLGVDTFGDKSTFGDFIKQNHSSDMMYITLPNGMIEGTLIHKYEDLKESRKSNNMLYKYAREYMNSKAFLKERANIVANSRVLVDVFNRKKSADRYSRSKTSKTGDISQDKLWSYKINDDIFKRVTVLGDSKNHGMIMIIDYSGSMSGIIRECLRQTAVLVDFCKKVGIPFSVYGFTSRYNGDDIPKEFHDMNKEEKKEPNITMNDVMIFEIISSDLNKKDYTEAFDYIVVNTATLRYRSPMETMGGTPLNEVLLALFPKVIQFRKKHSVQKMHLVMLTDGISSPIGVKTGYNEYTDIQSGYITDYDLKLYSRDGDSEEGVTPITACILRELYKKNDILLTHYYVASYLPYSYGIHDVIHDEVKQEGYVLVKSVCYDKKFLVSKSDIETLQKKTTKSNYHSKYGSVGETLFGGDYSAMKFANNTKANSVNKAIAREFGEFIS